MGLFTKRDRLAPIGAAELAGWRGRGHDLPDAGTCRWEVVFEALKVADDPALDDPSFDDGDLDYLDLVMAPLALRSRERTISVRASTGDRGGQTQSRGFRWGRRGQLRGGTKTGGRGAALAAGGGGAPPPFRLRGVAGRPVADGPVPPAVAG